MTPQYEVEKGLQIFKEKGTEAVLKELRQLHDMNIVSPKYIHKLDEEATRSALPYLVFLKRKRCGKIKGRGCADGRAQREFISKDEASSPTISLYAIILSSLIDVIENQYVVTTNIPGAFLQTDMPEDEDPVYVKFTGSMVEILEQTYPDLYSLCIVRTKKGKKIQYEKANKAILYGTLKVALLFWKKLKTRLKDWGFIENPYDACTINKFVNDKQLTIVWHVNDLKISHIDEQVGNKVLADLKKDFGGLTRLSTTTGKVHSEKDARFGPFVCFMMPPIGPLLTSFSGLNTIGILPKMSPPPQWAKSLNTSPTLSAIMETASPLITGSLSS